MWGPVTAALIAGCATLPPEPAPPFVESPAFADLARTAVGIIERDLNADGAQDAVVARRRRGGIVLSSYISQVSRQGRWRWAQQCSAVRIGEGGIDALRWAPWGGAAWVFARSRSEDPSEVVEHFAVWDPRRCTTIHADRAMFQAPRGRLVAPRLARGGVQVVPEGLRIVDAPDYLRLAGAAREVQFLQSVRVQRLSFDDAGRLHRQRERVSLLRARTLRVGQVRPQQPTATVDGVTRAQMAPDGLDMLTDAAEHTAWVVRQGQSAELWVASRAPVSLLELRYGCADAATQTVRVQRRGRAPYRGEASLGSGSGFYARGVAHRGQSGAHRALLAPTGEPRRLRLRIRGRQCLRELRAYGYAPPARSAEAPRH